MGEIQDKTELMKNVTHTPVLLKNVIDELKIKRDGVYVDATVGQGGHTREILKKGGKVIGIDLDTNQIERLRKEFPNNENLRLLQGNFADIKDIVTKLGINLVDGVIFDLGISFVQIADSKRGFSFKRREEFLDMRMSDEFEKTEYDILEESSLTELEEIFSRYSEEIMSYEIAQKVVKKRKNIDEWRVKDLVECIENVKGTNERTKRRIFQSLRIKVNNEIANLESGLKGASGVLKKNGRLCVISFHSVEDRIVKRVCTEDKRLVSVLRKPIKGVKKFERSAILRVFEKI